MCFATDEDDRTAEWVRPCRCRGSTKWVHQACLQRWVDEKQRGNSTARVACPQCNAEYLIVFPKLGKDCLTILRTAYVFPVVIIQIYDVKFFFLFFFLKENGGDLRQDLTLSQAGLELMIVPQP